LKSQCDGEDRVFPKVYLSIKSGSPYLSALREILVGRGDRYMARLSLRRLSHNPCERTSVPYCDMLYEQWVEMSSTVLDTDNTLLLG